MSVILNQTCGDSIRVVHPLFPTEEGGSTPTSPLQLHIGEISIDIAIRLNECWHSRLPNVDKSNITRTSRNVCYGAEYENIWYAVAIWSDPISRVLNGRGWLELRRFAISSDAPTNTASRLLRLMVAMIAKKFPDISKVISYQDTAVHAGTIYKGAGWMPITPAPSGSNWDTPSRRRFRPTQDKVATQKIRWEKDVRYALSGKDGGSIALRDSPDLFVGNASVKDCDCAVASKEP